MKKGILATLSILVLSTQSLLACDIHGKTGFAPANNLRISQFDKETNGMTKETFLNTVKKVSDIYAPVVSTKGATLDMINNWEDDTVNAYAHRDGNVWHVSMFDS